MRRTGCGCLTQGLRDKRRRQRPNRLAYDSTTLPVWHAARTTSIWNSMGITGQADHVQATTKLPLSPQATEVKLHVNFVKLSNRCASSVRCAYLFLGPLA